MPVSIIMIIYFSPVRPLWTLDDGTRTLSHLAYWIWQRFAVRVGASAQSAKVQRSRSTISKRVKTHGLSIWNRSNISSPAVRRLETYAPWGRRTAPRKRKIVVECQSCKIRALRYAGYGTEYHRMYCTEATKVRKNIPPTGKPPRYSLLLQSPGRVNKTHTPQCLALAWLLLLVTSIIGWDILPSG
ncbi:uncharacterized protein F4807DRAFT_132331 [Annulohypoxylon truncatum]|uniref:uncharacterized protein n=1 Tax=Annulohypoxylon truncatum TaxID=327061 RepID=UPI0020075453|nr:uncharacterized protein F4807DRAFT_132331 [Annulohypoxylon truncatum]KAI1208743.1 hypothetical protein F4807DRAFT_132331 [Annulohypoxylon truncatum]